jgi:hypothetical protein
VAYLGGRGVFRGQHRNTPLRSVAKGPETHPYFGMRFCALDSHTFWRNAASGCES